MHIWGCSGELTIICKILTFELVDVCHLPFKSCNWLNSSADLEWKIFSTQKNFKSLYNLYRRTQLTQIGNGIHFNLNSIKKWHLLSYMAVVCLSLIHETFPHDDYQKIQSCSLSFPFLNPESQGSKNGTGTKHLENRYMLN